MSFVKIKLNHAALRKLDQAAIRALEQTAEAIHTEIVQAQVIPFRTGHLQNDSTFVDCSRSAPGAGGHRVQHSLRPAAVLPPGV